MFGADESWKGGLVCPRCSMWNILVGEAVTPKASLGVLFKELTVMEAYAAFQGMGLPEELDCSPKVVRALFTEKRIKHVALRGIEGTARSTLETITLEDDTVIYLTCGGAGVTIYRIRRPHKYSEGVRDERVGD